MEVDNSKLDQLLGYSRFSSSIGVWDGVGFDIMLICGHGGKVIR